MTDYTSCSFCGAQGDVWNEEFTKLVTCPVCDGAKVVRLVKGESCEQSTTTEHAD